MSSAVLTTPVPLVDLALQHAEVGQEVAAAVERICADGAFVLGPEVTAFEAEYAAYSGVPHCVGVANGTDAIELALRAVGVGAGDEVILPANTFVATAGAVMRIGAVPVFVDCDPEYLLIDPALIGERVTDRTRAIVPVHLYGQLAPMEAVLSVAARHGLRVVEDAAQSQGAEAGGLRAGAFGDAAATSFYPGKNLGAYGDAGAVVTGHADVADTLRRMRNHGGTAKYEHRELGFNSRMDSIQAAVLRAKLRRLDGWNDRRRAAAELYAELLAPVEAVTTPRVRGGGDPVWHLYVVQVPDRDRVLAALNADGIGAGIHYPTPVPLLEAYTHLGHRPGDFPVAEAAAGRILSLPVYPGITGTQQRQVVDSLRRALG